MKISNLIRDFWDLFLGATFLIIVVPYTLFAVTLIKIGELMLTSLGLWAGKTVLTALIGSVKEMEKER